MNCGLLGRHLSHSYSPDIHKMLADYEYNLYEIEPEDLESFLRHGDYSGLNVTIPYKKAVLPYCDQLSDCAKKLGSVNTIIKLNDGSLVGHNTDYFGFEILVQNSGLTVCGKKVLILGSGGASITVAAVLTELGANVVVISRSGKNNYNNLYLHYDASVIVNTTPVGMFPNTDTSPICLDPFIKLEGVIDLIYNPKCTRFIHQAKKRGLIAVNGLLMLVAQAKESAEWFTGNEIKNDIIFPIYRALNIKMQNVILIGMPGSGKSTVGKALAKELGKTFVDTDAEIEKITKNTIPNIFAEHGEEYFRKIEADVIASLAKRSELVIATGGGCVTTEKNYIPIRQNSVVIWLQRNINDLPTEGRPLSQANHLHQMYECRKPLYEAFSDLQVKNDCSIEDTVIKICSLLEKEN